MEGVFVSFLLCNCKLESASRSRKYSIITVPKEPSLMRRAFRRSAECRSVWQTGVSRKMREFAAGPRLSFWHVGRSERCPGQSGLLFSRTCRKDFAAGRQIRAWIGRESGELYGTPLCRCRPVAQRSASRVCCNCSITMMRRMTEVTSRRYRIRPLPVAEIDSIRRKRFVSRVGILAWRSVAGLTLRGSPGVLSLPLDELA